MSHQPDQIKMDLSELNEQAVAGENSSLVDSDHCVVKCKFSILLLLFLSFKITTSL